MDISIEKKTNSRIKIVSWNVNGLRAIHRKGFLEWIDKERPDVLCIQEIKATEDQLPVEIREIKGYESFFNPASKKGYSGVAVYSKIRPSGILRGMETERFDKEGRLLALEYEDFTLFNIYYPNGGRENRRVPFKLEFYEVFLDYINSYRKGVPNLVICGDLNTAHKEIDLARPRENVKNTGFLPEERRWIDRFIQNGYTDTFRMFEKGPGHYTFWDYKTRARQRNVGWRLDYFFVSKGFEKKVIRSYMLTDIMGSDHCPIAIELGPC